MKMKQNKSACEISERDKALVLNRIKTDKEEGLLDWSKAKKQLKRKFSV